MKLMTLWWLTLPIVGCAPRSVPSVPSPLGSYYLALTAGVTDYVPKGTAADDRFQITAADGKMIYAGDGEEITSFAEDDSGSNFDLVVHEVNADGLTTTIIRSLVLSSIESPSGGTLVSGSESLSFQVKEPGGIVTHSGSWTINVADSTQMPE
jgi:hypothetical protein